MAGKGIKTAPRKKKANGYKLPDPIPHGEIFTEITKKQWILGNSIGLGGFGEIYAAAPYTGKTPKDYPVVIKVEPHENGPLFVEKHFYMRNAKPGDIEAWRKKKKLSFIGMPCFLGSGSHVCHNTRFRFLVMERYSTDLWKLFLENDRRFPEHTVYQVAIQIIDVLEYIHSRTYVHADIKGGNLLLGRRNENQVYLVDFGLASHYSTKTDYKLDPKKAHNGTIEYTSRDAHMGIPTMRGDLEILAYKVIQWLCGSLPWEKNCTNPSAVQKQKEAAFSDIEKFLRQCFPATVPEAIFQFLCLLSKMNFNDTPDYEKFKDILIKGLKDLGKSLGGKLEFVSKVTAENKATTRNKVMVGSKETTANKVSNVINEKKTNARTKRTPKKIVKDETKEDTVVKKVPTLSMKRLNSEVNSMNESMEVVMNNTCISGDDVMKKVLSSIDPDADYEVQIKKKKTVVAKKSETLDNKPTDGAGTSKKRAGKVDRKKVRKQLESESESETTFINVGTRSRPRQITPKTRKGSPESEQDMFDDC